MQSIRLLISFALLFNAAVMSTRAEPSGEFRLGLLAADLEHGRSGEYVVNAELVSAHIRGEEPTTIRESLFNPRLHLGASLATKSRGVDQVYAGLTWDHMLSDAFFVETSFGGTVHNGETASNNPDSYGCNLLFRESLSLGLAVSERLRLLATVSHMSNAGLCDENQGMTNAGVRLGYRW